MTQTHYAERNLEDIIRLSEAILVAKRIPEGNQIINISILPESSHFKGKNRPPYYEPEYHGAPSEPKDDLNYPPYKSETHRYHVKEVLWQQDNHLSPGQEIDVHEGSHGLKLDLFKGYYIDARRRSPIIDVYNTSVSDEEFSKSDELILFLTGTPLSYTWDNAYERIDKKQDVLDAIEKLHRPQPTSH